MLYIPINNVQDFQLASPRPIGGMSLTLRTGQGASVTVVPTRITVVTAGTYRTLAEQLTIFGVTAVNGDVLTITGPLENTFDRNYAAGDYADLRVTAGYINDLNEAVNGLLNPGFQPPTFTAFSISGQATVLEVGATIPASSSTTFTWTTTNSANVAVNSISIADATFGLVIGAGLANTGSAVLPTGAVTSDLPGVHTWTINGLNTNSGSFSDSFSVDWYWKTYYGINTNQTLAPSDVLNLGASALQVNGFGTFSFPVNGYKYYCIPVSFPQPSEFKDPNTNFNVPMAGPTDNPAYSNLNPNGVLAPLYYAIVSVTNAFGVTTPYAVYRSQNVLGGTYTIEVS